jgi:hypothetical protein
MAGFKNEQRRLSYRGRDFHFVSYEAQQANPGKKLEAMPETWYLISSGNRWPAIPCIIAQPISELDAALVVWLEQVVFAAPAAASA